MKARKEQWWSLCLYFHPIYLTEKEMSQLSAHEDIFGFEQNWIFWFISVSTDSLRNLKHQRLGDTGFFP